MVKKIENNIQDDGGYGEGSRVDSRVGYLILQK